MSESDQRTGWARRMRAMTGRIDSFFLPLEPVFLSTGERLGDLHRAVSQLSSCADDAGTLLASAQMSEMMDGLGDTAGHIDIMRRQRGGQAGALGQMIASTDVILASINALGRIMSQVQVLAVNAKIEASQLVNTGHDFTVFTREIARLAKSGEATIGAVRDELSGLRRAAAHAHQLQREFEERELPELDAVAERLAVSVRAMGEFRERAARGAEEIPQRLRTLFGHITNLVSNLQVFDTTRQRLEHVEQAMALAAGMIEADDASCMDEKQQRVFVNGIAELQSLQMVHAGDHYHQSVGGVGQSLAAMAQGAPAVAELCRRAFGGGEAGSLQDIDDNLEKASQVFANFTSVRQQASASLDHVVRAAARASELVRSLNSVNGDMRLMGLNASIKCGNMGSVGRALNVISQELQAYATVTGSHVEVVAGNLCRMSAAAANIVAAAGSDSGSDTVDAEALRGDIDRVVTMLKDSATRLSQLLDDVASLGESVVSLTRVADQGFSGKAECRMALDDGVRELKTLAAACDPGLGGAELEEARREVLAFTESHYTMASERSVHGASLEANKVIGLLTGAADDAKDAAASTAGEPDISALLF